MDRLRDEILEAQQIEPKPRNETETREMIIRPLLEHLGYKRSDIRSEAPDPSGKIPDFTIMPDTEYTWFLEAKDWRNEMNDVNATQAINYAHAMGRRWIVLSNGREWRLYDDTIQGKSSDRHILTVSLFDTESIHLFLCALSKDSIKADSIARFAQKQRMKVLLNNYLEDANSELIRLIVRLLRKDNLYLNNDEVLQFFKDLRSPAQPHIAASKQVTTNNFEKQSVVEVPVKQIDVSGSSSEGWLSLADPIDTFPIGKSRKPSHIKLPDGSVAEIKTWMSLYEVFFEFISKFDNLPPPPFGEDNRYYYNVQPTNKSGRKYDNSREIVTKHYKIYVDTSHGSWSILRMIHLCKTMNLPLESFQIKLAHQSESEIQTTPFEKMEITSDCWLSLADALVNPIIGTSIKPSHFKLPDNRIVPINNWVLLYREFFVYTSSLYNFPKPPFGDNNVYYYNLQPFTKSGKKFITPKELKTKNYSFFIETCLDNKSLLKRMIHICQTMNLPLDSFQFKLAPK